MKPMLAHIYEPKRWTSGPAYVQPKLNGVRALYQNGNFQSREELPWHPAVLAHLTEILKSVFPEPDIILDGELYKHGWNLQKINGAVQIARTLPREDTHEVEYHVFDRVSYQLSFWERMYAVFTRNQLLEGSKVKVVATQKVEYTTEADGWYTTWIANGFEGIMYRLGDCPYTRPKQPNPLGKGFLSDKNNRVWHLLKRKDWQDDEFECVGVEEGVGKRAGMVGAFVCRTKTRMFAYDVACYGDPSVQFNVGSGLSDAEATHYFLNQPIGRKIKVKFLTYTSDGKPFNPTVEAIL